MADIQRTVTLADGTKHLLTPNEGLAHYPTAVRMETVFIKRKKQKDGTIKETRDGYEIYKEGADWFRVGGT